MKIILFGPDGMLGNYIKRYFSMTYEVTCFSRKDVDLSSINYDNFYQFIIDKVTKNDIIINAAGVIKQRDYKTIDMVSVNSLFPHFLSKLKKEINCNVIHITTDCVYTGNKGFYKESDSHDCTDEYGKSKSLGENIDLTIIRTSIIGREKLNKKSLLEWSINNKNKKINGFDNHLWNGITCLELCKFIDTIIEKNNFWSGVRHIFSPETVSKFELLTIINNVYNLNLDIVKVSTPNKCFRNLTTEYNTNINNSLYNQIIELKNYDNNEFNR